MNGKFGKLLEANRALRKEIDALRVERQRFDNLYKKLEKEKEDLQREINDVIDQSTQAHDQRSLLCLVCILRAGVQPTLDPYAEAFL